MSKHLCVFFLFSEGKIEVLRKTSRTRTDEVQRRFPKTLSSITVIVQLRLLFRLRFLIRLDNLKEMSSLIALHLCTFHLWAQQAFRSRSVLSFGSKEKIGTQSWHFNLCTECPRSHCPFSGRRLVRSAFASRTDTSTWTSRCFSVSTQSRFVPLCSETWWHWKVTRGSSWSWASRVNTTDAKLSKVSLGFKLG